MKPTSAHINTLGKVQFPKEKNLETNHVFLILLIKKNFSVERTNLIRLAPKVLGNTKNGLKISHFLER